MWTCPESTQRQQDPDSDGRGGRTNSVCPSLCPSSSFVDSRGPDSPFRPSPLETGRTQPDGRSVGEFQVRFSGGKLLFRHPCEVDWSFFWEERDETN